MSTAIEVRDLSKTFRVPHHRVDSLKERMVHPFSQGGFDALEALRDVSFDVERGEFFGVVGRNGSGKSTLLKILASIYRASGGRIRMAGSVAPFIELGVGFNTDLTARENIVLNGVMMGLSRSEAAERIDAVLDFAELHEYVELKLKNYSSGMLVRLAFSVMLQAETDILLIDEVLAVGDAAFQQKCTDAFRNMRDTGRTVILVTHDMRAVGRFCDRAMLLERGRIDEIGDPGDVARRYLQLNFEESLADEDAAPAVRTPEIGLERVWLENASGEETSGLEHGTELSLNATFAIGTDMPPPAISFVISDPNGTDIIGIGEELEARQEAGGALRAGQRVRLTARMRNTLADGRYEIACWIFRDSGRTQTMAILPAVLEFVVYGGDVRTLVHVDYETRVSFEEGEER
jgi:ABC-type polysaccharide/polyol phosphate transport system ATPase subunit